MKRLYVYLAVMPVMGLLWLTFMTVHAGAPQPHNENCAACHLAGDHVNKKNAHQLLRSQEQLCGQCHQDALRLSHATGFTPKRVLPAEYPVDWKGDVTCSTCHDIHSKKPELLRGVKRGREFCLSCHKPAFFNAMPDAGTSILNRGHIDARANKQPMMIDSFSLQCISCHNGESDGGPAVTIDNNGLVRHDSGGVNHPIGEDYDKASKFGGYRSKSSLSKLIFLPDGKMGCVSCHQGYTQAHGKLVISNRTSGLCFECHDL